MFFWNSLAVSMRQQMLAIWSLVPLHFLNLACTSGSSQCMYCWSQMWRIFSMTLLAHKMSTIVLIRKYSNSHHSVEGKKKKKTTAISQLTKRWVKLKRSRVKKVWILTANIIWNWIKMYNSDYNSLRRYKIRTKYIDNVSIKSQIILIKTGECGWGKLIEVSKKC